MITRLSLQVRYVNMLCELVFVFAQTYNVNATSYYVNGYSLKFEIWHFINRLSHHFVIDLLFVLYV